MVRRKTHTILDRMTRDGVRKGDIALVARQPVFDLEGRIWGYELLFRDPSHKPGFGGKSSQAATSTVMIDGFELMRPLMRKGQKFLINFTAELLAAELPSILPPDLCVIEILETVEPTKSVLQGLKNMKQQGYTLALDDYTGQKELEPFLDIVDIVKVDVLELTPLELRFLSFSLHQRKVILLAEKVEDNETARICRSYGFSLFQGYFFSKAELLQGKKLNPSQVTKARLLAFTSEDDVNVKQIIQAIVADVFLTYKLLRYVNSLYFGLPVQIRNAGHAVMLLGNNKLRQWLYVTALAEMDATPMAREIVYISALRAKFLETLALRHFEKKANCLDIASQLFLVGLFSLLEGMLQVPITEALASIAVDEDVMQVLTDGTGRFAPWYSLMEAYERGDWDTTRALSRTLSLSYFDLASAYVEAGSWSAALFGDDDEKIRDPALDDTEDDVLTSCK